MNLNFDAQAADGYRSTSQKVRVLSEQWVGAYIFCPNCGHWKINKHPNNQAVADFFCPSCLEDYELKSKQNTTGAKILDGAYRTKMDRLESDNNPNLFVLIYGLADFRVLDFFVVPKHFFTPDVIEERKPLSDNARRTGWIGSSIILQKIPESGKIFLVKQQHVEPRENVLASWNRTLFLRDERRLSARGWLLDVMRCVDRIGKREFTIDDVYFFGNELGRLHPRNKHIRHKIRQQLQFLRDKGYLGFVSRGLYRLT